MEKRVTTKVPKGYDADYSHDFSGVFDFEEVLQMGELAIRSLDYNPNYPPKTSNIWVIGFNHNVEKGKKTSDGLNFQIPTLEYEQYDIQKDAAAINLAISRERWWEHCCAEKLRYDCKCTSVIRVIRRIPTFLEDDEKLYLYSEIGFVGLQRKLNKT